MSRPILAWCARSCASCGRSRFPKCRAGCCHTSCRCCSRSSGCARPRDGEHLVNLDEIVANKLHLSLCELVRLAGLVVLSHYHVGEALAVAEFLVFLGDNSWSFPSPWLPLDCLLYLMVWLVLPRSSIRTSDSLYRSPGYSKFSDHLIWSSSFRELCIGLCWCSGFEFRTYPPTIRQ